MTCSTLLNQMLDAAARRMVKPSTRAFWREGRALPGYTLGHWLHGYAYARWPYLYIGLATGQHPLARRFSGLGQALGKLLPAPETQEEGGLAEAFAAGYHGKVMPTDKARLLVSERRDIELRDLEQVVPYAAARDIVLRNPDQVAALQCPCRSTRQNPCTPLDVCLIVGEPFAGFVLEHHPQRARRLEAAEALDLLQAEHERGHVHHAFFKDAMLQRFYAICNCCSCCCGAMQAHRNGVPMLASSGYLATAGREACSGCGLCARRCPFGAIIMQESTACIDPERCLGCGVCTSVCPEGRLQMAAAPQKGVPLDIRELAGE